MECSGAPPPDQKGQGPDDPVPDIEAASDHAGFGDSANGRVAFSRNSRVVSGDAPGQPNVINFGTRCSGSVTVPHAE